MQTKIFQTTTRYLVRQTDVKVITTINSCWPSVKGAFSLSGGMVDTVDSKSTAGNSVKVQVLPWAPIHALCYTQVGSWLETATEQVVLDI